MIKYFYQTTLILLFFAGLIPLLSAQPNDRWWLQSSLADSVTKLQFHASGMFSYSRMKGVIVGKTSSGNLTLVLRKGIFTNFSRAGIDIIDLKLQSSSNLQYATTSSYFTDYVDIDITKQLFIQIGYIWERDDALRLKNRHTLYGGIGFNTPILKKINLKSLVASGRIDPSYTIQVDDIDVVKDPYAALYGVIDLDYTITSVTSISSKAYYFTNLDDWDRHRYGYFLNLKVNVWKSVSLIAGYHYKYDEELKLLGLIPDNSTQNIGIEVSL